MYLVVYPLHSVECQFHVNTLTCYLLLNLILRCFLEANSCFSRLRSAPSCETDVQQKSKPLWSCRQTESSNHSCQLSFQIRRILRGISVNYGIVLKLQKDKNDCMTQSRPLTINHRFFFLGFILSLKQKFPNYGQTVT